MLPFTVYAGAANPLMLMATQGQFRRAGGMLRVGPSASTYVQPGWSAEDTRQSYVGFYAANGQMFAADRWPLGVEIVTPATIEVSAGDDAENVARSRVW